MTAQPAELTKSLIRIMTLTCAITVANLYYAQPLLHAIAVDFRISQSAAGLIVTATQFGYAAGLLFIVPLGDVVRRRPLLVGMLLADAVIVGVSALSDGLAVMGALALLTGLVSVVVQMLIPYAATLAKDTERSRVIGTLMGGLLVGILLSRTFAGVVDAVASWRIVYLVAGVLMLGAAAMLYRALPDHAAELSIGYRAQLRGVLDIARRAPTLRWRALLGASAFGAFSCFWTTIAFLLAGPHYHFDDLEIGLFALVGAAGAVTSYLGGRAIDARPRVRWPASGVIVVLLIASFGLIDLGSDNFAMLVVGVLLMDACVQGAQLVNQSVIYELLPQARSRITTVYMTTYFVGGALGSAAGAQAYERWGWNGACCAAACFGVIGLGAWWGAGRHERRALIVLDVHGTGEVVAEDTRSARTAG